MDRFKQPKTNPRTNFWAATNVPNPLPWCCRALSAAQALFLRETSCLESQHTELSSLISLLNGLANGLVVFHKHLPCELIVFTLAIIFKEACSGHSTNIPFAAGCPFVWHSWAWSLLPGPVLRQRGAQTFTALHPG